MKVEFSLNAELANLLERFLDTLQTPHIAVMFGMLLVLVIAKRAPRS